MSPEAAWRVFVEAAERLPDSEVVDREDLMQLRTPSSRYANHNRVMRARFGAEEADARIAAIVEDHRARGAGLSWVVDHGSAPADLSARLEACGVARLATARGMVRTIESADVPALPAGVRLGAATRDDAPRMGRIAMQGWRNLEEHGRSVTEWVERAFDRRDRDIEFSLVWLDDALVGYAVLHVVRDAGYLQGACVLPAARGRGLYTALTHARLARLHALGIEHAVIWADASTSAPIAERLGFADVATAVFHELPSS